MGRHWRIYRAFFVSSLARDLEFRANFIAKVFQNLAWVIFYLLIILVIYSQTKSVAGWTSSTIFVLMASVFTMSAVYGALFMALMEISEQVRKGTLDFVITKPVDTQFWVSLRRFNFDRIGSFLVGLMMLGYGLITAGIAPNPLQWLLYLSMMASSLIIFYSLNMILMTMAIYFVRIDNLWVLGENILEVARFPINIYGSGVQQLLTYWIPIGFLATLPAQQLVQGPDLMHAIYGWLWAGGAFLAARWFWNLSLANYTSASS